MVTAVADADGVEARMGYLSGVPKYPRKRGKTQVAKVAGVHGLGGASGLISKVWDATEPERARRKARAIDRIMKGADAETEMLNVAEWQRDQYRDAIRSKGLEDTGRLIEGVRAAIFDGKTWVAGDDPKQPRMGNKGPF
jgi:uncharacterized protein YbaA (DUF1428 family)